MKARSLQQAMLVSAALWLSGCGSLTLQVDVLDPTYVDTVLLRQDLFVQLQQALDESHPTVARLELLRAEHRTAYLTIADAYAQEAETLEGEAAAGLRFIADEIVPAFDRNIAPEYATVVGMVTATDAEIQRVLSNKSIAGPGEIDIGDPGVAQLLLKRLTTIRDFSDRVAADLEFARESYVTEPDIAPAVALIAAPAIGKVETKLDSLIENNGLVDDPLAYAVASAEDKHWAESFNHTFGKGYFGNLNFAIKMESLADFTIKGLTFDPSAVAAVASKVSAQSLIFAAQIAGVPVSLPNVSAGSSGQAAADRSKALADMQTTAIQADAELRSRQNALARIAERILAEADNISSDDKTVRDAAKDAIAASFEAQRPLLIPASNNEGGS